MKKIPEKLYYVDGCFCKIKELNHTLITKEEVFYKLGRLEFYESRRSCKFFFSKENAEKYLYKKLPKIIHRISENLTYLHNNLLNSTSSSIEGDLIDYNSFAKDLLEAKRKSIEFERKYSTI